MGPHKTQAVLARRLLTRITLVVLAFALALSVITLSPAAPAFAKEGEAPSTEAPTAPDADANRVDPTQRADNSFIYDTTVASLFSQASLYNERTVQVVGEVIGDRIATGNPNYCWITLTETNADDKSSISVHLSTEQTGQIAHYGRYGVVGTTLQVRGIYHQACDQHDGLPDIHASASSALAPGEEVPDTLDMDALVPGLVTVIIGVALMGAFYFARERTR